jgi:hypothetical protein
VTACAEILRMCGNSCVDTSNNPSHCGACGRACPAGQICSAGKCDCPGGRTLCDGVCVQTNTDRANCGACNNACLILFKCAGGTCRPGL